MSSTKINLITPPDKLFNLSPSIFLIKPSKQLKIQFQNILSDIDEDLNVYIFDDTEYNIEWLLSVSQHVDFIIVDVDHCDPTTKLFLTFIMAQPNVHYITNDEITPYNLINRNRIYNLDWIINQLKEEDKDATED